jgi:hypothetical protein
MIVLAKATAIGSLRSTPNDAYPALEGVNEERDLVWAERAYFLQKTVDWH